jgi:hypothetical protein
MPKASVGLLVFFYCLKTLGYFATTVGVFLALSYLRSWLHSAWKKETERSSNSENRGNNDEDSATEYERNVGSTEANRNISSVENALEIPTFTVNSTLPKNDL